MTLAEPNWSRPHVDTRTELPDLAKMKPLLVKNTLQNSG